MCKGPHAFKSTTLVTDHMQGVQSTKKQTVRMKGKPPNFESQQLEVPAENPLKNQLKAAEIGAIDLTQSFNGSNETEKPKNTDKELPLPKTEKREVADVSMENYQLN